MTLILIILGIVLIFLGAFNVSAPRVSLPWFGVGILAATVLLLPRLA